jgi:D-aminopeptidase
MNVDMRGYAKGGFGVKPMQPPYAPCMDPAPARCRFRDLGVSPGTLPPGPLNAITDVAGVLVGHATVIPGDDVRTGVTAVLPHAGNPYRERVPAGLHVGNGFGKLIGATQLVELGELETPVLLTNTLAAPRMADALIDWTLALAGNEDVRSVNPFVGETNDGRLNDIRARGVTAEHALAALATSASGPVAGGNVGAGTGTVAFGLKGGIGTSSRVLPRARGGWTVGALVQANFGGELVMDGLQVGRALREAASVAPDADGSIMIVLATDAPLSDRNLTRLAARAMAGLARTGAAMSDGSGDYAVAFSTASEVRRVQPGRAPRRVLDLPNDAMSPLFLAAIEATEEAILDALCLAETMPGYRGRVVEALPLDVVRGLLAKRGVSGR